MPRRKKLHWTQTPEGRAKLSKRMKFQHALKHKEELIYGPEETDIPTAHLAYAYGRVEAWLHAYADALGLPGRAFAARVGQGLVAAGSASRQVHGPLDSVPALR